MNSKSFEPKIIFPDDPFEAAVMFLAVMAYPERGAGAVGKPGSAFASALVKYCLWYCSKARGLRYMRQARNEPTFVAPKKREFQGALERGMRRIARRDTAYGLFGMQILHGFVAVMAAGPRQLRRAAPTKRFTWARPVDPRDWSYGRRAHRQSNGCWRQMSLIGQSVLALTTSARPPTHSRR